MAERRVCMRVWVNMVVTSRCFAFLALITSSPLGTFREEERLRLSDRNSLLMTQNLSGIPVRSANWSTEQFHCSSY